MVDDYSANYDNNVQHSPPAQLPLANQHPLYQQTQLLMNRGDWTGAHALLLELLRLYPNHPHLSQLEAAARARVALMGENQRQDAVVVELGPKLPGRMKFLLAGLGGSIFLCVLMAAIFAGVFLWPQASG